MTKHELINAFWQGEIGEVEFFEVGMDIGISADELNQVMSAIHEEDGTI